MLRWSQRIMHVNISVEYTPILNQTYYERDRKRGLTKPAEWSNVVWEKRNDVWIPQKLVIGMKKSGTEHTYELEFDWVSVNESVPDRLFSLKNFEDVPEGTEIRDQRPLSDPMLGDRNLNGHTAVCSVDRVRSTGFRVDSPRNSRICLRDYGLRFPFESES